MKHLRCWVRVSIFSVALGLVACGGGGGNDTPAGGGAPVTPTADITPDGFAFTSQVDVAPSGTVQSNEIIVSGIDAPAAISVEGGVYAVDGGEFTSVAGSVEVGQRIVVQVVAAAIANTTSKVTLTIGGISADFTVTTVVSDAGPLDDTTPDAFTFTPQADVAPSGTVQSNEIIISGINAPAAISVEGGTYAIDGGEFTSAAGTVSSGQHIVVQMVAADTANSTSETTLTIGDVSATFSATTGAVDVTPEPFSFSAQTDVEVTGNEVVSEPIIVKGINVATPISIAGGEYSIDDGAFTKASGQVVAGQSVRIRLTAPTALAVSAKSARAKISAFNKQVNTVTATLIIGNVSADFTVSFVAPDTTPDAFSFNGQKNAELGAQVVSNAIRVSGIAAPAPISVSGGEYAIDGGSFTAAAGSITEGQSVTLRLTAASSFSRTRQATLSIGDVSATFTVTTLDADSRPSTFSFTPQTDVELSVQVLSNPVRVSGINTSTSISIVGGEYGIDGGSFTSGAGSIRLGQSVQVRLTASDTLSTATSATLTIGGVSAVFTATTIAEVDTTPDSFSFTEQTDVELSAQVLSNTITVNGINTAAAITITGGEYRINGGSFTATAGTVEVGQSVQIRLSVSDTAFTTASATLTIGGVSAVFTATTIAEVDTTPDSFSFTEQTDVELSAQVLSNTITVNGINTAAAITITGGEYRINGGSFTATAGTVEVGQSVQIRLSVSDTAFTTASATLTIGGVSAVFTATTIAEVDTTPDSFSFTEQTDVELSAQVLSNTITVNGINTAAAITITGGEYRINGGSFTATAGTVEVGQSVQIRLSASDTAFTTASATLTIGGVSAVFNVTTANNNAPTASVVFPPAKSFTTANTVIVRGTAVDAEGDAITGVTINGVDVQSDDGFATWQGEIELAFGQNTLVLATRDDQNNIEENAVTLEIESSAPAFSNPVSLVLDNDNNRALVLDDDSETLFAVNLNTGERTVLSGNDPVSGAEIGIGLAFNKPMALVLDSLNNRVFVVDDGLNSLIGVNLNNGNRVIFSGLEAGSGPAIESPRAIVLESANTVLVLNDSVDAVFRVDLSTGERVLISTNDEVDGPLLARPQSMVLDAANNRLLIIDERTLFLIAMDLTTGQRTLLFSQDENDATPAVTTELPLVSGASIALNSENDSVFLLDDTQCHLAVLNLVTGQQDSVSLSKNRFCDVETDQLEDLSTVGAGVPFINPQTMIFDNINNRALLVDSELGLLSVDISTGKRTVLSGMARDTQSVEPNISIQPTDMVFDNAEQRLILSYKDRVLFAVDTQTGERSIAFDSGSLAARFGAQSIAGNRFFTSNGNSDASVNESDSLQEISFVTNSSRTISVNGDSADLDTKLRNVEALTFDQDTGLAWGLIGLINRFDGSIRPKILAIDTRETIDNVANPQLGERIVVSGGEIGSGPEFIVATDMVQDGNRLLVIDGGFVNSEESERRLLSIDISKDSDGNIDGSRQIVSNTNIGSGPAFTLPRKLSLDTDNNRVLVLDIPQGIVAAKVFAVDLDSGDRTLLIDPEQGSGPPFKTIIDIVLGNNGLLYARTSNDTILLVDLVTQQRVVLARIPVPALQ